MSELFILTLFVVVVVALLVIVLVWQGYEFLNVLCELGKHFKLSISARKTRRGKRGK